MKTARRSGSIPEGARWDVGFYSCGAVFTWAGSIYFHVMGEAGPFGVGGGLFHLMRPRRGRYMKQNAATDGYLRVFNSYSHMMCIISRLSMHLWLCMHSLLLGENIRGGNTNFVRGAGDAHCIIIIINNHIHMAFFSYNGYSVPDRTGTSTGLPMPSCVFFAPPPRPLCYIYIYSRPIVTTCLYSSALLAAELGSCLHP